MVRHFFSKRFKLKNIYEAKDDKFISVFIQSILVGSLIAFPLVFQILKTDSSVIAERVFAPFYESKQWQQELPNCVFGRKLTCSSDMPKIINYKNQRIVFDPTNQYDLQEKDKVTIIFGEKHIHANILGFNLYGGYNDQFIDLLKEPDHEQLFIATVASLKMQAVAMIMQLFYPITIITNLLFIAIIAFAALLFNIGNSAKLTFRQFFSFLSYAATIPAIIAFVIGIFFSIAFLYIAYNFSFIFFAYYIYRKYNRVV